MREIAFMQGKEFALGDLPEPPAFAGADALGRPAAT
jgi:hypothetical protein